MAVAFDYTGYYNRHGWRRAVGAQFPFFIFSTSAHPRLLILYTALSTLHGMGWLISDTRTGGEMLRGQQHLIALADIGVKAVGQQLTTDLPFVIFSSSAYPICDFLCSVEGAVAFGCTG